MVVTAIDLIFMQIRYNIRVSISFKAWRQVKAELSKHPVLETLSYEKYDIFVRLNGLDDYACLHFKGNPIEMRVIKNLEDL